MLQVNNVSLQYGSKKLFEEVNLKFTKGNCYGIIGANGAGKSTFLKVLSGEIEPNKGEVTLDKNERMSVLMQNQNAFDDQTVVRTVMLGHKRLVEIMDQKDALYAKEDFTPEDGIIAVHELAEELLAIYESALLPKDLRLLRPIPMLRRVRCDDSPLAKLPGEYLLILRLEERRGIALIDVPGSRNLIFLKNL